MFYSLLELNLRSRRVQRELADRYELHRTVMHALKPACPVEERLLYRLETTKMQAQLLVQTQTLPDWSFFTQEAFAGYLQNVRPNPQVKQAELRFSAGQRFAFRLVANPTERKAATRAEREKEKDGKRVGLYRQDEQLGWLNRKGEAGGFRLLEAQLTELGMVHGRQDKDLKPLRWAAAQFDGLLEVTAADLFYQTVCNGIGSAKGFGFGLLSLARM